MMREQSRQYDKQIAIGEHAEMRDSSFALKELHSTAQRILTRLISCIAVFAGELNRSSPLLVVKLDPDLPRHVWAPSGEDRPQHSIVINQAKAEIGVDVSAMRSIVSLSSLAPSSPANSAEK